jgi:tRNA pseudouridine13 synthase
MPDGSNLRDLPLLTKRTGRLSGTVKSNPEDFRVEEIPLYELEGAGPHLYMEMTKRNITTDRALDILRDFFGDRDQEFGVAGRKDKRAVTTQRVSLEHLEPEEVEDFHHEKISLTVLGSHRNKLQPGHLEGNRFTLKIRELETEDEESLPDRLDRLAQKGVPNYFGPQRFGRRDDSDDLGEAMVQDQLDRFLDLYLGQPRDVDPPACRKARELYEKGDHEDALDAWPEEERNKKRALATFLDRGDPLPVLSSIPKSRRQLFLSAYQSRIFNELLADRMPAIDRIREGDIAKKTDTGGLFEVQKPDQEQARADAFDISPTGLLPGGDPWMAEGTPGKRERTILQENNLSSEKFDKVGYLRSDGTRRPFRFSPGQPRWERGRDDRGPYGQLEFTIPSGCYATVLLREILQDQPSSS